MVVEWKDSWGEDLLSEPQSIPTPLLKPSALVASTASTAEESQPQLTKALLSSAPNVLGLQGAPGLGLFPCTGSETQDEIPG